MKKNNAINRNTNATAITFTQAKTVVTADRYVPHALYTQNKAIVEKLGGEIVKGVGEFRAKFAKVADAKQFVKEAVTFMPTKEYNATRKTEPAPAKAKSTNGKGRVPAVEYVTLTDSDGLTYQVPKSALAGVSTKTKTKGKGNNKPTPANTKAKKVAEPKTEPAKRGRKAKGDGFDFTTIKGADNRAKNKALHQALVKMGMPDSRTPEYMAVWNARPWAK